MLIGSQSDNNTELIIAGNLPYPIIYFQNNFTLLLNIIVNSKIRFSPLNQFNFNNWRKSINKLNKKINENYNLTWYLLFVLYLSLMNKLVIEKKLPFQ